VSNSHLANSQFSSVAAGKSVGCTVFKLNHPPIALGVDDEPATVVAGMRGDSERRHPHRASDVRDAIPGLREEARPGERVSINKFESVRKWGGAKLTHQQFPNFRPACFFTVPRRYSHCESRYAGDSDTRLSAVLALFAPTGYHVKLGVLGQPVPEGQAWSVAWVLASLVLASFGHGDDGAVQRLINWYDWAV